MANMAMEPAVHWGWQEELRGAGESGSAPRYQQTQRCCWSREVKQAKETDDVQSVRRDMSFFMLVL